MNSLTLLFYCLWQHFFFCYDIELLSLKLLLKIFWESNRSNSALQAKQYGREFSECSGFFQLALELRRGQTQPGGLQHRLPGRPACASTASLPHCRSGVLPLLLLSP
ncbi:hypothetical protein CHARACLAT_005749 [Characodon lateralis]|uniref:Uncharacterized protein n=1 Tax=Characodon lateralis TaxID=208331 RepID=A0ABU7DNN7_9TELE|nr:hypothetical protein [Characodon lateralis]